MRRTLLFSLAAMTTLVTLASHPRQAIAEDAPAAPNPIEVTGFVDTYFAYKLNQANDLYRNFDGTHNAFSLALTEIAFEKKPNAASRVGFRADLDFGPAADAVGSLDPYEGSGFLLEQAYVSYLPGKLQIDAGKFVTQHGAEVIEAKDDWNYSRSLLFALAIPYYHVGLRAVYSATDKVTVGGFLVNGWNNTVDNNSGKTFGAMVTLKPTGKVTLVQNVMWGPEQDETNDDPRLLADTVVTVAPTSRLSLMANLDYGKQGDAKWLGVAGYARYQIDDRWAVSPRVEWLDDSDGFMTTTSQKLMDLTLTVEGKLAGGLLARLEVRRDFSDTDAFTKDDGTATKGQNGITLGLIYAFGGKLGG